MKKIIFAFIFIIIITILFFPCLFIRNISGYLVIKPLISDVNLKISYIHSVQKTPIEEFLIVHPFKEIMLYETRYQSFGVGLPFLESEGEFFQEGNAYVMKINRKFDNLSLRYGKGTKLTLQIDEKVLPIYQEMAVGSKIEIYTKPFIIGRLFK